MTPTTSAKPRIAFIDLAKGFCILLVVFHHLNIALGGWHFPFQATLATFRIPLYFFLSGLFFKTYDGFAGFLVRKTNKLLIPFLVFHILSSLIYPLLIWRRMPTVYDFFGYVLSPGFLANGPIWFLMCLFWMNLLFYVIYLVAHATRRPTLVVVLLSCLCGALGFAASRVEGFPLGLNLVSAFTGLPFFAFGYLARNYTSLLTPNRYDRLLPLFSVAAFAFVVLVAASWPSYYSNTYDAPWWKVYAGGLAGLLSCLWLAKWIGHLPVVSYNTPESLAEAVSDLSREPQRLLAMRRRSLQMAQRYGVEGVDVWLTTCFDPQES